MNNKCYSLLFMNEAQALAKAIEIAKSQEKLAGMIGFTQPAIARMVKNGIATAKAAPLIEIALEGQVTHRQLRPHDFEIPKQTPH